MELAAPNMFETVFRTLPIVYLRFCNMPVLPLDYSANGDKMLKELIELKETVKDIISLEEPIKYVGDFKKEYMQFYQTAKKVVDAYDVAKENERDSFNELFSTINMPLIKLSRILNNVLLGGFLKWDRYSSGLYVNDFDEGVLASKSIPCLIPLNKLVTLNHESDEYWSLLTKLVRNRNKVSDALRSAIEIIKSAREEIERTIAS